MKQGDQVRTRQTDCFEYACEPLSTHLNNDRNGTRPDGTAFKRNVVSSNGARKGAWLREKN